MDQATLPLSPMPASTQIESQKRGLLHVHRNFFDEDNHHSQASMYVTRYVADANRSPPSVDKPIMIVHSEDEGT